VTAAATRAIELARQAGIDHRVHSYESPERRGRARGTRPSFGLEAAAALGVAPDRIYKTLVATVDDQLVLAAPSSPPSAGTFEWVDTGPPRLAYSERPQASPPDRQAQPKSAAPTSVTPHALPRAAPPTVTAPQRGVPAERRQENCRFPNTAPSGRPQGSRSA